jgi:glyoxylase-like metal-dependent hydrolase (beta-lactamase superfamily II)
MRVLAAMAIALVMVPGRPAWSADGSVQKVITINDHLLAFYDGRDPSGKRYRPEWNWVDDGAMKLGIATYAIHKGDRAIVFDTFTSPDQARWVRDHLERAGIRRFTIVLSHWHPDHVGGNIVYRENDIIAADIGRETMVKLKDKLEGGEAFGPPGIKPLILPTVAFHGQMELYLDDLKVELHNLNIHSPDSVVIRIPSDGILLAGDTLEDSVTFMVEIGDLPEHVKNLKALKGMSFERIYPNHGDPKVIANGGYGKTFIDATADYITKMLTRAKSPDYLSSPLDAYIGESVRKGWISLYEPYREVHKDNLKAVYEYFKDRRVPAIE